MYSSRIFYGCIKGHKISWAKKLNISEILFVFFTFLFPIVLISGQEIIFLVNFAIATSTILAVRDCKVGSQREWKFFRKWVLGCSVIVQVAGIFFLILFLKEVSGNNLLLQVTLIIGVVTYISVVISFLLILINLLFYCALKILFPHESDELFEDQSLTFEELSPFMNLQNQIAYFILTIIHSFIYLVAVIFVFGGIAVITEKNSTSDFIEKMEIWIVNSGLITTGNTLGLLSIILTLLTITVPFQTKILNKAYEKCKEEKNEIC